MCCPTHYQSHSNSFTVTAFFVRFRTSTWESKLSPLPDSLALILSLPPYSLSLTRIRQAKTQGHVIFGSKQRVRATTQAMNFQLHAGETKLLKGVIRKHDRNNWRLECCKWELPISLSISEVELLVALDGVEPVRERVVVKRNNKLEDIPEETELPSDNSADANAEVEEARTNLEMDLEVLKWAMDVGIWVLCLGFGYMLSRASKPNIRPPRRIFDLYHLLS
ncbi:uncharacterized protein LOC113858249 [Abrus precatorius]|uniref:Uncharacterized protein LOC113858249 n=1 Tax=Abrus precatorius TaxID=3816 RepID=A0A8B8KVP1_ABRPR|nr:uncharacterized protein LOC113858249 [Abrus precatorius]